MEGNSGPDGCAVFFKGPQIISQISISCPKSDGELRDLGFTKLVKRDDGVYENVTARDGDSRYMERGKPDTIPDLSKTVSD